MTRPQQPSPAARAAPLPLALGNVESGNRSRLPWIALKAAISLLLIAWILRRTDLGEVLDAASGASVPLLLVAFLLQFVGVYFSSRRWRVLLRAQGVPAELGFLFRSFLVGLFFNNLLPSTIGGDAVRGYDTWRLGARRGVAVAVMFVDRFLGLAVLMAFTAAAVLLAGQTRVAIPHLLPWVLAGSVGMAAVVWIIFTPSAQSVRLLKTLTGRLPAPLQRLRDSAAAALLAFRGRTDALARAAGFSLLIQLNVVLFYYLVARSLGLEIPLLDFFLIVPLALFVMLLPISINAIGVRENVFAFFLAGYGISVGAAVAFAWLAYLLLLVEALLGGMVYALRDNRTRVPAA